MIKLFILILFLNFTVKNSAQNDSIKDTLPINVTTISYDLSFKPYVTGDILYNPYKNSNFAFNWDIVPPTEIIKTTFKNDSARLIAINHLQGLWSAHWTVHTPAHPGDGAAYHQRYCSKYFYVENDSIWKLDYPCSVISVEKYSPEYFHFVNDSVIHHNGYRYSKLSIINESSTLEKLKTNDLNPDCYLGEWRLSNVENGGDGTGIIYVFPFNVPDSIFLTKNITAGKSIKLWMDGEEKEFDFTFENGENHYQIILTPTESWKVKDKQMWRRDWYIPAPNKKELKKIRKDSQNSQELYIVYQKF